MNRREFLRIAALGLGSLALNPLHSLLQLPEFPESSRLGRILSDQTVVKARADIDSADVGLLNEDAVVPWL